MMISVALVLAMGCGKEADPEPQGPTKAAVKPDVPGSKKGQPTPKKETPQPKTGPEAIVQKPGTVLWEFKTGGSVSSLAIGSDGTVYVGSGDTWLYAINGKNGVKLWEFETVDAIVSSPAIGSDGTVYVGSDDSKLYALSGKSGVKLWEFETGAIVSSSPAIGPDGTVYVGSHDKKLYAIKTDSKGLAKSPWPMRGQNPQHTARAMKK